MYLSKNKKSGIIYLYYRQANGKKTRKSTGTRIKREAIKFLTEFEKQQQCHAKETLITLSDFTNQYLEAIRVTHSHKSYILTKGCFKKFKEAIGENTLLKDINRIQAESYILKKFETAKHSAALQLRHLKASFNRAIDWGYIEVNPFKGIRLRLPENHPVYITREELDLILENEPVLILRQIFKFAFNTGMRAGEIVNLEWSDVDMEKREMKVSNKTDHVTKSKRERIIPMADLVFEILASVENEKRTGFVFPFGHKKFEVEYISRKFKKAVRAAKLNDAIHFHSLRHSFASSLVQKGCNLYVVKQLLGHSNISVTQKYAHLSQENLKDAIDLMDL